MKIRVFKQHPFRLGAWLLSVSLAFASDDPYLPKVGPVPLRFQRGAGQAVASGTRADGCPCEGTAVQAVVTPIEPAPIPTVTPVPIPETHVTAESPALISSSVPVANPVPVQTSATDLLSVNPQMFVDYFKPAPGNTNAVIAIPVPVGFVPPLPPAAGSRAAYRSQ